ncbi:polysaccharide deacetylase family protein, partial [Thiomicrorhabdus chilensis]|uniref:polysaccharide deacetylase family protein n=1 Tax=Thiomicrorhabdus chilensis TaxID=63656 RepID=UPI00041F1C63
MSNFIISLDFEMFWGVVDSKTINNYSNNILGVKCSLPKTLTLFREYHINATWATVGMLMCNNFNEWVDYKPSELPNYTRSSCSTYGVPDCFIKESPDLFFAPDLVNLILDTEGQELASHTYSHFFCGEQGASVEAFKVDCQIQRDVFSKYDLTPESIVFPRNQVTDEYVQAASEFGLKTFRGNSQHWVYKKGHFVPYGGLGKVIRKLDSYIPLTGFNNFVTNTTTYPINVPASLFFRPSASYLLDTLQIMRIKRSMLAAAKTGKNFHLWWHPHNFGVNIESNLYNLEEVLKFYKKLEHEYGMQSKSMKDVANEE